MNKLLHFLLVFSFLCSCSLTSYQQAKRTFSSLPEVNCSYILDKLIGAKGSYLKSKFYDDLQDHLPPRQTWLEQLLKRKSKMTYSKEFLKSTQNLEALYFIDYTSSLPKLIALYMGKDSLNTSTLSLIYGASFGNYLRASEYLAVTKPGYNLNTLKTLHTHFMFGGVDDIPFDLIGKIRTLGVKGNIHPVRAIGQEQVEVLNENPFINSKNIVKNSKSEGYIGAYSHPSFESITPELLEEIHSYDSQLYERIVTHKALGESIEPSLKLELTHEIVTKLIDRTLSWFILKKNFMGEINTAEKLYDYIKLVAQFYRELMSIHPFYDGNGRTLRQFSLYQPFIDIGLLPPRLIDPESDLLSSFDDFVEEIIVGLYNSQMLYQQFEERLEHELPLASTPELLLPYSPELTTIGFKQESPRLNQAKNQAMAIDSKEVAEYFKIRLEDSQLKNKFEHNALSTYEKILNDYLAFFYRSNLDYQHPKVELERLSIHLIDRDFMYTFNNQSFKNKAKWNFKMKQWYSSDIVWRGLSNQSRQLSELDIKKYFTEITPHLVSNDLLFKNKLAKNDVIKNFDRYNHNVIGQGLEIMSRDHSEAGPGYTTSYGYSTSKKREVGKAFAMGAMVIAPYGKQMEFQHLLKSRVLIGVKRANKDVDLTRLKQLRPDFSYQFPRQAEVMGIGAADPDSVMTVQLLDEKGNIIRNYIRNPENPNQILIYDREVDLLAPLPGDFLGTWDL